jgi:hypothetical protein
MLLLIPALIVCPKRYLGIKRQAFEINDIAPSGVAMDLNPLVSL